MAQANVLARAKRGAGSPKAVPPRRRRTRWLLLAAVVAVAALSGVIWQVTDHGGGPGQGAGKSSAATPGSPAIVAYRPVPEASFASQPPFTGPAVAKYGQAAVQAGYREMVNFAFETGWNPNLMAKRSSDVTTLDFAQARAWLTASCAKAFDARVAKAIANDKSAIREMEGSMFIAVGGAGNAKLVDAAHAVTDRAFTRAKVAVDTTHGRPRLSMSFTVKALVHLQNAAGKPYVMQTGRAVRYLLVPNQGADAKTRPFLIDSWANHMQTKPVKPA